MCDACNVDIANVEDAAEAGYVGRELKAEAGFVDKGNVDDAAGAGDVANEFKAEAGAAVSFSGSTT